MGDFLYPKRAYRCGERASDKLHEVLPRTVTVNRAFDCGSFDGTWRGDPFAEVATMPAVELFGPDDWHLCNTEPSAEEWDVDAAVDDYLAGIEVIIDAYWAPDKHHVVYHSSGWDSRILSSALARLRARNGDGWLGDVLFVSNKWEAEGFKAIMALLGFSDRAFVWREHIPESDYFDACFDFAHAWRWLNAPCPIPVNLWHYLVQGAQVVGLLPSDERVQGVAGYWANELVDCFLHGGKYWLDRMHWYPNTAMASLPFPVEMVLPFAHKALLEQLPAYGLGRIGGKEFRKLLADRCMPDAVGIPNVGLDDRGHPISDRLRQRALRDYQASWYGRHVRPHDEMPATTQFSNVWADWSLASLCEHLRREGYDVR